MNLNKATNKPLNLELRISIEKVKWLKIAKSLKNVFIFFKLKLSHLRKI